MLSLGARVIESVVHEVLDSIDDHLSDNDDRTLGRAYEMDIMCCPAYIYTSVTGTVAALENRPPLPLPADQREGVESVTLIGDTDEY